MAKIDKTQETMKYFNVVINQDNTFDIVYTSVKNKRNLSVKTLANIYAVIQKNLTLNRIEGAPSLASYKKQQHKQTNKPFSSPADQEAIYAFLKDQAQQISQNYSTKIAKVSWIINKVFGKEKKVKALKDQIDRILIPNPFPHTIKEVMALIGDHLDYRSLLHLRSTNKEMLGREGGLDLAASHLEFPFSAEDVINAQARVIVNNVEFEGPVDQSLITFAKKQGFQGDTFLEAQEYLKNLHEDIEKFLRNQSELSKGFLQNLEFVHAQPLSYFLPWGFSDIYPFLKNYLIYSDFPVQFPLHQPTIALLDEALRESCNDYRKDEIKFLIKHGANPNITLNNFHFDSPLHKAIIKEDLEMVKYFLKAGADAHKVFNRENSLGFAFRKYKDFSKAQVSIIKFLLDEGADPNCFIEGFSPLRKLIENRENVFLPMSEDKGFDDNLPEEELNHQLFQFSRHYLKESTAQPQITLFEYLLAKGATLQVQDFLNENLLIKAVFYRKKAIVDLLIAKGMDVNTQSQLGTSLHYACLMKDLPIIKALIEAGADINAVNKSGKTPLCELLSNLPENSENVVEFILKSGANPNLGALNNSPIYQAYVKQNNPYLTHLLLEYGATPNHLYEDDSNGINHLMHHAAQKGDLEMLHIMHKKGCKLTIKNSNGATPLMFACGYSGSAIASTPNLELIHFLLDQGVDIDAEDQTKSTALHYALKANLSDVVNLLLDRGANPKLHFRDGGSLLHLIKDSELVGRLVGLNNTQIDIRDAKGKTPLMKACKQGYLPLVKCFISQKADLEAYDHKGLTPLHYALASNNLEVIRFVIQHSKNVDSKGEKAFTPLATYCLNPNFRRQLNNDIIELLLSHGADPNVFYQDRSVVHNFANSLDEDKMQLFVKYQVNLEKQDVWGETVLTSFIMSHHDTSQNREFMVKLLNWGANPHQPNRDGKTALQLAEAEANSFYSILVENDEN